ncbi:hypothetical protein KAR91_47470 [Candidatus Pacearchaeota archaeon]|nr:hypothetical protein [Candidatus Pacearchaeota archaeon]
MSSPRSVLDVLPGYAGLIRKFGRKEGIGTTESVIWDGGDAFTGFLDPTTEEDLIVVSDSVQDADGGTGCKSIMITGQGIDGLEKSILVPMNGTTSVDTSTLPSPNNEKYNITYRSNALLAGRAASITSLLGPTVNVKNVGTITITSKATTKIMAIIKPNEGQTQMCVYRCPSNLYGDFMQYNLWANEGKGVKVNFYTRLNRGENSECWNNRGPVDIFESPSNVTFPFPELVAPGIDVVVTAKGAASGTSVSCQFFMDLKEL